MEPTNAWSDTNPSINIFQTTEQRRTPTGQFRSNQLVLLVGTHLLDTILSRYDLSVDMEHVVQKYQPIAYWSESLTSEETMAIRQMILFASHIGNILSENTKSECSSSHTPLWFLTLHSSCYDHYPQFRCICPLSLATNVANSSRTKIHIVHFVVHLRLWNGKPVRSQRNSSVNLEKWLRGLLA